MPPDVEVNETILGPGMPTLRIGRGERDLLCLPGLTISPGLPTGNERKMAVNGWEPLLDRYTIHRAGRPSGTGDRSFAEMADDVIAAIGALRAPVDLMGFSTGGVIAFHVAAARPELVRRLVLVASGPKISANANRLAADVMANIRQGSWANAYASLMSANAASQIGSVLLRLYGFLLAPRLIGTPADPGQLLSEIDAWRREDARDVLVAVPTLVIANERDRIFPVAWSRELAARLPRARLVEIPKKGHSFPGNVIAEHVSPFLE